MQRHAEPAFSVRAQPWRACTPRCIRGTWFGRCPLRMAHIYAIPMIPRWYIRVTRLGGWEISGYSRLGTLLHMLVQPQTANRRSIRLNLRQCRRSDRIDCRGSADSSDAERPKPMRDIWKPYRQRRANGVQLFARFKLGARPGRRTVTTMWFKNHTHPRTWCE